MRRIAAWTAAALMGTAVLVGCSDGEAGSAADEPATPASTATEETSSPAATPEPSTESTTESTESSGAPTFDPTGSYCDVLASMNDSFGSFDPQRFDETVDQFRVIADAAPPEVADEWDLLVGVLAGLDEALADLGLSYADLADPESMADLDAQDAQRIAKLAERLTAGTEEAMATIQEHAGTECDVDLGG